MANSKKEKKELVVIGAGPGGYAAAFRAADLGIKTTLIDPEANPGGVCLYRGCIPSKALLHVAKVKKEATELSNFGLSFDEPEIDVKKIAKWKDGVVKKLTGGLGQLSKARKVEFIQGKAFFKDEKTLEVEENSGESYELEFENAIIATGSTPTELPNIEVDHKLIWNSKDALDLKEIPKKLLVIGGGYIGLELGSVYANLGSEVSIAEMTSGFLPGADRDLVKVFEKEQPFKNLYFDTKVEKVDPKKKKVEVVLKSGDKEEKKKFDKVLVAIGRQPNAKASKPQNAGVEIGEDGFIKVFNNRKTSAKNIYAIGDITGQPMLAHKASHEGRIAAEVIKGEKGSTYDAKVIPAIVFTDPEIAWCGLTEEQLKSSNIDAKVVKFPWSASGRAKALGTDNGLTKLIVDKESEVILGGGVAGKNAGSLIPEIALAIEMGTTARDLSLTVHPHPTLSETIMESAELFYGSPTHIVDN